MVSGPYSVRNFSLLPLLANLSLNSTLLEKFKRVFIALGKHRVDLSGGFVAKYLFVGLVLTTAHKQPCIVQCRCPQSGRKQNDRFPIKRAESRLTASGPKVDLYLPS